MHGSPYKKFLDFTDLTIGVGLGEERAILGDTVAGDKGIPGDRVSWDNVVVGVRCAGGNSIAALKTFQVFEHSHVLKSSFSAGGLGELAKENSLGNVLLNSIKGGNTGGLKRNQLLDEEISSLCVLSQRQLL